MLLQHGDKDIKVNVNNSLALAEQFKQTNRPHKHGIYTNETTGFLVINSKLQKSLLSGLIGI